MFILPTFDNLKIRQVPWATIFLMVICFWVFFVVQHKDSANLENIILKYGENGLLQTEAEAFVRFQSTKPKIDRGKLPDLEGFESKTGKEAKLEFYGLVLVIMLQDEAFQNALKNSSVISPGSPEYEKWYYRHKQYTQDMKSVIWFTYSFKPAWPSWTTSFTSMFLHADVFHLLGNMVFLFIAGTVLEAAVGSIPFLLVYLLVGILESWLTIPLSQNPAISCLGASGAISGIMGTYSTVLGMRKIPVFLSLGFFFTNTKLPAIFLIVIWALKEVIYFFLYPNSNVNYMAHFCGYLVGGAAGIPLRLWCGERIEILFDKSEEKKKEDVAEIVSQGIEHLKKLEFIEARSCMVHALEHKPADIELLQHLFSIDRQLGDTENLKSSGENLLRKLLHSKEQEHLLLRSYRDYTSVAGLALPDELLFSLAARFAKLGHSEDMMQIILYLGKKKTTDERFASLLLLVIRTLLKREEKKKAAGCAALLVQLFPNNQEAKIAKSLFNNPKERQANSAAS